MDDICEVGEEESGEQDVGAGVRNKEKGAEQAEYVDGCDAENTLPVEVSIVGGTCAISKEQRSDEEAGEDEEDVDTGYAELKDAAEFEDDRCPVGGRNSGVAEVMEEDEQGRDASETVELAEVRKCMELCGRSHGLIHWNMGDEG